MYEDTLTALAELKLKVSNAPKWFKNAPKYQMPKVDILSRLLGHQHLSTIHFRLNYVCYMMIQIFSFP